MTGEEFVHRITLLTVRSLQERGPAPPSPARAIKEELHSPPCNPCQAGTDIPSPPREGGVCLPPREICVQIERRVKEEPASPPCKCGIQMGCRMKEEPASPRHSRYAHIDGPESPPYRNWCDKKELPPRQRRHANAPLTT